MKFSVNIKQLPLLTLGAGGLGFVLRLWYFSSQDAKGLFASGHFANTLSYLLLAAALALIVFSVRSVPNGGRYQRLFPTGLVPAIGCTAGAMGIIFTCIGESSAPTILGSLGLIVGMLAACSLLLVGLMRFNGQRPNIYPFAILALYMIIHALIQVRDWNKETQQTVIFFPLLASLFLLVCVYYHANLALKQDNLRNFVFFQQAALLLCCFSLKSDCTLFYLGMGAWLGCDLCTPQRPQRSQPQPEES